MTRIALLLPFAVFVACSSSPSTNAGPGDGSPPSSGDAAVDAGGGSDAPAGDAPSGHDGSTPTDSATPPAEGGGDGAFVEASHPPFPQVTSQGGPSMTAPKFVTISFSGDGNGTALGAFGDWIVTSTWLAMVGHDYGVGPGTHVMNVVLPGPAPATASDLDTQSLLEENLQNGTLPSDGPTPEAGAPDAGLSQYIYLILYPSSTTTGSFLDGPSTCTYEGGTSFIGGYHWETQSGAYHVAYAVIPTCTQGTLTEQIADIESSASHEFIEASTDPFPDTDPAYVLPYSNPWSYSDGEVADLCEGQPSYQESGFSAQPVWSNTAAMANGNPCVPTPPVPYYGAAPPASQQTVTIAAGSSTTLTLTGFSTAPLAAWPITTYVSPFSSFTPGVMFGASSIDNGQTTTMTISVPSGTASQSYAGIFIDSLGSGTDFCFWPIAVNVQ